MAWCPHCGEDRPIQRQTYDGPCPYCTKGITHNVLGADVHEQHLQRCRSPVIGALDVCSFCNEVLFAKAKTLEEFIKLEEAEENGRLNAPKNAGCVGCAGMILLIATPIGILLARSFFA